MLKIKIFRNDGKEFPDSFPESLRKYILSELAIEGVQLTPKKKGELELSIAGLLPQMSLFSVLTWVKACVGDVASHYGIWEVTNWEVLR
ncbi:hypothetical protein J7K42_02125 [bacterium]|nr:hypothetical protein [bacterium]